MMKSTFRKFIGETKGIAAIEIAFIMPFMLLIYFGLFDITALVSVNRKVTYSASIVADLVAQNKTSVLKSKLSDYYSAANLVMAPISSSAVRIEVFGYRIAGSTVSLIWKTNNGQATSCGADPVTTAMAPLMVAGNDLGSRPRLHELRSRYRRIFLGTAGWALVISSWRKHYATAAQHTEADLLQHDSGRSRLLVTHLLPTDLQKGAPSSSLFCSRFFASRPTIMFSPALWHECQSRGIGA